MAMDFTYFSDQILIKVSVIEILKDNSYQSGSTRDTNYICF